MIEIVPDRLQLEEKYFFYVLFSGYTDWEGLDVEPLPIYAEQYFETQAQVSQLSRAEAEAAAAAADLVPTLTGVPDTCCLRRYRGCGRDAFEDAPDSSALREVSIR